MERNNAQRVAALAIVTSLALGGAHPAAAAGASFLDRLGSFWSVLTGEPGAAPAVRQAAERHGATRARQAKAAQGTTTANTDKGWGLDPNGNSVFVPLDPTGLH
jgi:hypothetical protein